MTIILTVTNDLTYDQRMQRICTSLAAHGYTVELVGRQRPASVPLTSQPFAQKRLRCRFERGFAFYAEYNLRLFAYLLVARYDAVCSIDLDTLAAGCGATLLRRKKRVFDAHEYFTEVPEVVHRPVVRAFWGLVARLCLPFYRHAYTVGPALAEIFAEKYGLAFKVVRNTPQPPPRPPVQGGSRIERDNIDVPATQNTANTDPAPTSPTAELGHSPPFTGGPGGAATVQGGIRIERDNTIITSIENIDDTGLHQPSPTAELGQSPPFTGGPGGAVLYQGALNAGRGLEAAIAAMQQVDNVQLWLAGEGDLSVELRQLAGQLGVQEKVHFLGFVRPEALKTHTAQAWLGLNLLENCGLSYYYSLANKYFDYVQAGVPVLTMDFPEYRALNAQHEVALLLDELSPARVAAAIRRLRDDEGLYARLQGACAAAGEVWIWEEDEKVLLEVWQAVYQNMTE